MLRSNLRLIRNLGLFILPLILLIQSGCDQQLPAEPTRSGNVTILKSFSSPALHKGFKNEVLIDDDGGSIWVGEITTGYSGLVFPEKALDDDTWIAIVWMSESLLQMDCYPSGERFDEPVYIQLSYKDADITGIDEDDLAIYWYDPVTEGWEFIGDNVNTSDKYVSGYINHFSRYAIGYE